MVLYRLTKSKFIRGQQCPKALYLDVYRPEVGYYPAEVLQRFARGRSFEATVKAGFEGGIDIMQTSRGSMAQAVELTGQLLSQPSEVTLFEAAFVYDEVLVLADILHKRPDGQVSLYEVKNAKEVSEVLRNDVYLQHYVIAHALQEHTDMVLSDFSLLYNDGDDHPLQLSLMGEAREALPRIEAQIQEFKALLQGTEPPIAMGPQCESPYLCPYQRYCSREPRGQQEMTF